MALASEIIQRAYRRANLIAVGQSPTTDEQTEGLNHLNTVLLSALGNTLGTEIFDLTIGGTYDQSAICSTWIPCDVRLILNLGSAQSFNLDPSPYEGQRLAVVDSLSNLGTHNLTLSGNGRTIEGATSLTLSTSGTAREWLYRSDTGDWVKITSLLAGDSMPLPAEFDQYFIDSVALMLSPQFSAAFPQEVMLSLASAKQRIRARYRKPRPVQDMPHGLLNSRRGAYGLSQADFNAGRTYK